jgi:hypothetical protein
MAWVNSVDPDPCRSKLFAPQQTKAVRGDRGSRVMGLDGNDVNLNDEYIFLVSR